MQTLIKEWLGASGCGMDRVAAQLYFKKYKKMYPGKNIAIEELANKSSTGELAYRIAVYQAESETKSIKPDQ
jgi:hypothetical protein